MEASRLKDISTSMIRRMFEIVEKTKKEGKDIVSLTIGEPDFPTPKEVIERAYKAMNNGFTHYTSNFGIEELRIAIADEYGVSKNEVMVTAGGSEALLNASLAFIEEGSRVVIPSPSFLSYFTYAKMCKAKIIEIKTHETNFVPTPESFAEIMSKDVSVVFLNYPNNPTGAVIDKKSAEEIVKTADDYGAIVVSDEIYDKIYYDKKPVSLVNHENVVVVNGFSKSLAMTGWRIGFVIAREELLNSMLKIHQVNGVCAPAFAQKAVAEVMQSGEFRKLVSEMVSEFRRRRDFVYNELSNLYWTVKPEGAFYMFLDVKEDCTKFAEKLIDYGVAVTPGRAFGSWNDNFVRISYANSMENLKKAVERIKRYYEDQRT
ncbi:MAG: aminotransferase class I/II-fold pyridoxal phosphate-dependent enzyme [Archaeoglobaceae archaeon]